MMSAESYAEALTQESHARTQAYADEMRDGPDPCVDTAALPDDPTIEVYDNVLSDPQAYRESALSHPFQTFMVGDIPWHGLAKCQETELAAWLSVTRPDLTPSLSLFRRSPAGQVEPNFIHTDKSMGDATVIFYLNEHPADDDGTRFWRHRWSGATESQSSSVVDAVVEEEAWRDTRQWELRAHVDGTWNRAVVFPGGYFHSRAIFENYGEDREARLTQIMFCRKD